MIINIRGTHGSGKSTLVKQLIDKYCLEDMRNEAAKINGYALRIPEISKLVFVVGPYETACGGCDAVQPYDLIWPRVEGYSKRGHVIFEGALVSTSLGVVGQGLAHFKKKSVVAYLDTPVELCLQRIAARRAAKGDTRPLNPKNTVSKVAAIARTQSRFEALGVRCVTFNHKKAFKQLLELLHENN